MKIGDIITSDGVKRKIVDFSLVEGMMCPNTIIIGNEPEMVEKEPLTATEETKAEKYVCQYCGRECASAFGLRSHERKCSKNPDRG